MEPDAKRKEDVIPILVDGLLSNNHLLTSNHAYSASKRGHNIFPYIMQSFGDTVSSGFIFK